MCNADRTTTPSSGSEVFCADTACGNLADFYALITTGLTSTCTADSCALSCPAGQMPTYLNLPCDSATRVYGFPHSSDSNTVECVSEYETPCGTVDSAFTMTRSDFNITCSGLESFHQTTPVTCELTCADQFDSVVGESTVVCENGAFTNAGSTITCEPDSTVKVRADTSENVFAYNCPNDVYLVNGVVVPGWETFLTHSGTGGLFRMVENDWNVCYLAMTTNPASEEVEWKFELPSTQTSLIQVYVHSTTFQPDNGNSVVWNFCVDDSCQEFDRLTQFNYTEPAANSIIKIKALMTANTDWKFAQLFRQALADSLFDRFEIRFHFDI
ncbi:unnamed protein product [Oikopleura dioica]|uniref:PAW domain-containing protein n=1 Tax=Oikopleura dioica TaxID=34765 RepID=E4XHN7_OIKDI|nr:unnamed protein product [Oikopleura dioica]